MNVQDYNAPSVTALSVQRCNADGTANDQGGYVKVTYSATVSSMNNKNYATYKLKYKKSSATSYTTVTLADQSLHFVSTNSKIFEADINSSYDVEVIAQDRHKTASRSTSASTAFTLMNFNPQGNGIGVGRVCEGQNSLQIGLVLEAFEQISAKKGILIDDTRNENLSPAEYRDKGRSFLIEFKLCSVVSLNATTNNYCTVITFVQWNDTSGGSVKQLLLDDDHIWYRTGIESWGAWKAVL
jgi:hypothetical protein